MDTVLNYLAHLADAFLLTAVPRFDLQGRKLLQVHRKHYLGDVGLRHGMIGYRESDVGGVLENLVFLELRRRGYTVTVGAAGPREIDFVAERRSGRRYVQVAYLLESPATIARELAAFAAVRDAYPPRAALPGPASARRPSGRPPPVPDRLSARRPARRLGGRRALTARLPRRHAPTFTMTARGRRHARTGRRLRPASSAQSLCSADATASEPGRVEPGVGVQRDFPRRRSASVPGRFEAPRRGRPAPRFLRPHRAGDPDVAVGPSSPDTPPSSAPPPTCCSTSTDRRPPAPSNDDSATIPGPHCSSSTNSATSPTTHEVAAERTGSVVPRRIQSRTTDRKPSTSARSRHKSVGTALDLPPPILARVPRNRPHVDVLAVRILPDREPGERVRKSVPLAGATRAPGTFAHV